MLDFLKTDKDKARYSLLFKIIQSKTLKECTDYDNYYIAQGDKSMPVWVWNKSDISKLKLSEILERISMFVSENKTIKIVADEKIYQLFKDNENYEITDYFEMGSYYCLNAIEPKKCDGKIEIASLGDLDVLVKYGMAELKELDGIDADYNEISERIKNLIDKGIFYVWKNENNKIVCSAVTNISDEFARFNLVYTPIEERCKGYAKNLMYCLTEQVLCRKLLPVLYTDYNYPASNRTYKSIGYQDLGKLIRFSVVEKN